MIEFLPGNKLFCFIIKNLSNFCLQTHYITGTYRKQIDSIVMFNSFYAWFFSDFSTDLGMKCFTF